MKASLEGREDAQENEDTKLGFDPYLRGCLLQILWFFMSYYFHLFIECLRSMVVLLAAT